VCVMAEGCHAARMGVCGSAGGRGGPLSDRRGTTCCHCSRLNGAVTRGAGAPTYTTVMHGRLRDSRWACGWDHVPHARRNIDIYCESFPFSFFTWSHFQAVNVGKYSSVTKLLVSN